MKGIAHFVTGIAGATLFPEVVEAAAGGSILPVLGGVAAILPDTLDFRFVRFFERHDLEIDPGPEPDPGLIAHELAELMREAYESDQRRTVMLHSIRLGPDEWRRYIVRFDSPEGVVAVRIGPVVDTSQVPLPAGQSGPRSEAACAGEGERERRTEVGVPMAVPYGHETTIDIFSGPSLAFWREDDGLRVEFLPWHRRWSHSATLAAVLGLIAAGVAAFGEYLGAGAVASPQCVGLVVSLGVLGHVVQDQLGFMGSNLLFPFTRGRTRGLGLIHSADGIPNFLTVWSACIVILLNLDRASAAPRLPFWWFLGLGVIVPWVLFCGALARRCRRAERREPLREPLREQELLSEMEEDSFG